MACGNAWGKDKTMKPREDGRYATGNPLIIKAYKVKADVQSLYPYHLIVHQ
jgi:hypothetical protein